MLGVIKQEQQEHSVKVIVIVRQAWNKMLAFVLLQAIKKLDFTLD